VFSNTVAGGRSRGQARARGGGAHERRTENAYSKVLQKLLQCKIA
jgi:hypothetical protein